MAKENNKNWVNYKEIKEKISMQMVLEHYGIELKKSGQNLAGCCPIYQGTNRRQFSVSPERNIWNCFGNCKEGGNVLDFVAMMEFGNKEPQSIRKAALQLKNWFLPGSTEPGGNKRVSGRLASGKGGQAGRQRKRKDEPRQRADRQKANLSATLGTGKRLPVLICLAYIFTRICLVALKKS